MSCFHLLLHIFSQKGLCKCSTTSAIMAIGFWPIKARHHGPMVIWTNYSTRIKEPKSITPGTFLLFLVGSCWGFIGWNCHLWWIQNPHHRNACKFIPIHMRPYIRIRTIYTDTDLYYNSIQHKSYAWSLQDYAVQCEIDRTDVDQFSTGFISIKPSPSASRCLGSKEILPLPPSEASQQQLMLHDVHVKIVFNLWNGSALTWFTTKHWKTCGEFIGRHSPFESTRPGTCPQSSFLSRGVVQWRA